MLHFFSLLLTYSACSQVIYKRSKKRNFKELQFAPKFDFAYHTNVFLNVSKLFIQNCWVTSFHTSLLHFIVPFHSFYSLKNVTRILKTKLITIATNIAFLYKAAIPAGINFESENLELGSTSHANDKDCCLRYLLVILFPPL